MKTLVIMTCTAPGVGWLYALAQTGFPPVNAASWLEGLASLGFAGFAWYMLAVRDPRRDKEHREERDQWRDSMDKISERSSDTAEKGHAAALELTIQLQRIVDIKKSE